MVGCWTRLAAGEVFQRAETPLEGRSGHTATRLLDGKVLFAGGAGESQTHLVSKTAEIYDPATGVFTATEPLLEEFRGHAAVLLKDGRVLVTGGPFVSHAEVFDPVSGSWTKTAAYQNGRSGHTATVLPDGKVLIAGGKHNGVEKFAEIYDPVNDEWVRTGDLNEPRMMHTATLLPSGKVLVVGGLDDSIRMSGEIYDPETGTWTLTAPLAADSGFHSAALLPDGTVLISGRNCQIYDPEIGSWTPVASCTFPRDGTVSTVLADGRVLLAGSSDDSGRRHAEVYDPAKDQWREIGELLHSRDSLTATLLEDGGVLIAGGGFPCEKIVSVEKDWQPVGSMSQPRAFHTATRLADGRVLVTGGRSMSFPVAGNSWLDSCEIYDPTSRAWSPAAPMSRRRSFHQAVLLGNRKVLVFSANDPSLELYDPESGIWSDAGSLPDSTPSETQAILLGDGRLFICTHSAASPLRSRCSIYDPEANLLSELPDIPVPRRGCSWNLLPDGRLMVIGGSGDDLNQLPLDSCEIYDPAKKLWTSAPSLEDARVAHSVAVMRDGSVLVAGGYGSGAPDSPLASCERYDPVTNTWAEAGSLSGRRANHQAILTPGGKVLVLGGVAEKNRKLTSCEIFDGTTGQWSDADEMLRSPSGAMISLLADGGLLIAGGRKSFTNHVVGSASVEVLRGDTMTWQDTASMHVARGGGSLTELEDGTLLAVGGTHIQVDDLQESVETASAEIYDPELAKMELLGNGGQLLAGTDEISFGKLKTGRSVERRFVIRNVGTAPLTELGIDLDGAASSGFMVASELSGDELRPGEEAGFTLRFAPRSSGVKTTRLLVRSSLSRGFPMEFALRGASLLSKAEIRVEQPFGSGLADGRAKRNFGTAKIGTKGATLAFSIRNMGDSTLRILSVSAAGRNRQDFGLSGSPAKTLGPGEKTIFRVTFLPTGKGRREAVIRIRSNDDDETPFEIGVSGLGASR